MKPTNKLILFLAAVVCFLLVMGNFTKVLSEQERIVPDNPIRGISAGSSQVLWTGEGYYTEDLDQKEITAQVLETETEIETEIITEVHTEIETEIITEIQTELSQETEIITEIIPGDPESSTVTVEYNETCVEGEGEYTEPAGDDNVNQEGAEIPQEETADPEAGRYPVVASDLTDGETVPGTYRTFYVRGEDYRGNYIGADGLEVYGNGELLYSTSDSGDAVSYRLDLLDDSNEITIRATDRDGRNTTVTYTIYKGEAGQAVPAGSITFSLEATTVGLGYLIGPVSEVFYEGEQLSYVIDRAIQSHGYTYSYDGSLTNGFYLKHVISPGITSGYSIPEDLLAHLESVNCAIEAHHTDSLGQFDFTQNSGWMYSVNGAGMSSGISTYYPADGDEVRIRFTLYGGADVGGGMQGESWGDW